MVVVRCCHLHGLPGPHWQVGGAGYVEVGGDAMTFECEFTAHDAVVLLRGSFCLLRLGDSKHLLLLIGKAAGGLPCLHQLLMFDHLLTVHCSFKFFAARGSCRINCH